MNKKQEKTIKRRELILKSAMEMFSEVGYDNFTTNFFCTKYGISKGVLYHNYSGKEEIFLNCVEICHNKMIAFLQSEEEVPTFERYIELRLEFYRENPILARIFYESVIQKNTNLHDKIDEIRKPLNEFNEKVYTKFLDDIVLKDGIKKEEAHGYFSLLQKMLNSYYSSPVFYKNENEFYVDESENLKNYFKYFLYGIVKN